MWDASLHWLIYVPNRCQLRGRPSFLPSFHCVFTAVCTSDYLDNSNALLYLRNDLSRSPKYYTQQGLEGLMVRLVNVSIVSILLLLIDEKVIDLVGNMLQQLTWLPELDHLSTFQFTKPCGQVSNRTLLWPNTRYLLLPHVARETGTASSRGTYDADDDYSRGRKRGEKRREGKSDEWCSTLIPFSGVADRGKERLSDERPKRRRLSSGHVHVQSGEVFAHISLNKGNNNLRHLLMLNETYVLF